MLSPREFARRSLAGIAPKLRVLVACEYSGIVRDAFTTLGHDAVSCDLLPTERPGDHYQGNVFDIINQQPDTARCVQGGCAIIKSLGGLKKKLRNKRKD